jgi:hypothetical protein
MKKTNEAMAMLPSAILALKRGPVSTNNATQEALAPYQERATFNIIITHTFIFPPTGLKRF